MEDYTNNVRYRIIETFAQWIAFSGTRSGCPLKSRDDIYPLIQTPDYSKILVGNEPITKDEFNLWHEKSSLAIHHRNNIIPIGWATKLINIYLKEMVYVGQYGRPNLIKFIHPPIDNGLWKGIKETFRNNENIISKTHSKIRIKDIIKYQDYQTIINGIELASKEMSCLIIEVEQLWKGTKHKTNE